MAVIETSTWLVIIGGAGAATVGAAVAGLTQIIAGHVQSTREAAVRREGRLQEENRRIRSSQQRVARDLQVATAELLDAVTIQAVRLAFGNDRLPDVDTRIQEGVRGVPGLAHQLEDERLGHAVICWSKLITLEYGDRLSRLLTYELMDAPSGDVRDLQLVISRVLGQIWRDLERDHYIKRSLPPELETVNMIDKLLAHEPDQNETRRQAWITLLKAP